MKHRTSRRGPLAVALVLGLVVGLSGCRVPISDGFDIAVIDHTDTRTREIWAEYHNPTADCTVQLATGVDGRDWNHYTIGPNGTLSWRAVLYGSIGPVMYLRLDTCWGGRNFTYVIAPGSNGPGYWMFASAPDDPVMTPVGVNCGTAAAPCAADGTRYHLPG